MIVELSFRIPTTKFGMTVEREFPRNEWVQSKLYLTVTVIITIRMNNPFMRLRMWIWNKFFGLWRCPTEWLFFSDGRKCYGKLSFSWRCRDREESCCIVFVCGCVCDDGGSVLVNGPRDRTADGPTWPAAQLVNTNSIKFIHKLSIGEWKKMFWM